MGNVRISYSFLRGMWDGLKAEKSEVTSRVRLESTLMTHSVVVNYICERREGDGWYTTVRRNGDVDRK